MKIEYIKLTNHIPFKENIEIALDQSDSVIMIKGRTGSGKSFLVNNLHPLSGSGRHSKAYSIYPSKSGYKEIIYSMTDGGKIKIRHEYTPNSKGGHSCKSYFSTFESGFWKEHNESGHNKEFEMLVKKFLSYETKTAEFSSLNVKSSGFIQSTSDSRNKTLFSLVESDIIKTFKDNLSSNISDNNSRLRLFKESRDKILLHRNIESDRNRIVELLKVVDDSEIEMGIKSDELHKKIEELAIFKTESVKFDFNDLEVYNTYFNNTKHFCATHNISKVSELISLVQNMENNINKLANELNTENINNRSIKDKIENMNNLNILAGKINELTASKRDIEKNISKKFNLSKMEHIYKLENLFTTIKSSTFNLRRMEIYNCKSLDDIRQYQQDIILKRESLITKKAKYEQAYEFRKLIKSKEDTICKSCGNDVDILKQIYDSINIDSDMESIKSDINNYTLIIDTITNSMRNIKSSIQSIHESGLLTSEFINELGVESLEKYVSYILFTEVDVEDKFFESRSYGLNQINIINRDLMELNAKYNAIKVDKDTNMTSLQSDLDISNKRIESIKFRLDQLDSSDINSLKPNFNINDIMNYDIDDVKSIYESSKNIDKTIKSFENSINELNTSINDYKDSIQKNNDEIIKLERVIEDYESTNEYVKLYSDKKKQLDVIKTSLFQDIPTMLLDDNIRFIEDSVNQILSQCDVNMTVSFVSNANKTGIDIPVYVNGKEIPDAGDLSSGETSMISTLVNTTLLSLLGYRILIIDELDAHIDTVYRNIFSKILSSICYVLDIDQIFCISHNINLDTATSLITVGSVEGMDIDYTDKKVFKIQ